MAEQTNSLYAMPTQFEEDDERLKSILPPEIAVIDGEEAPIVVTEEKTTVKVEPKQSSLYSMTVELDGDNAVVTDTVEEDTAGRDDAGNLLPVAYDPSELAAETAEQNRLIYEEGVLPEFERDGLAGQNWKSVRASIIAESKRRAKLSPNQLEEENESISESIRNPYTTGNVTLADGTVVPRGQARKAGPMEALMASLFDVAPEWVLGFGNFVAEVGAVAKDELAMGLRALQSVSPTALDRVESVITGNPMRKGSDPYDLADQIGEGFGSGFEFMETLIGLGQINSLIQKAEVVGYRATASTMLKGGADREIDRLNRVDAATARVNINKLLATREKTNEAARIARNAEVAAERGDLSKLPNYQPVSGALETSIAKAEAAGANVVVNKSGSATFPELTTDSPEEVNISAALQAKIAEAEAAGANVEVNKSGSAEAARVAAREQNEANLASGKTNNPGGARIATIMSLRAKREAAAKVASENADVAEDFIIAHETQQQKINPDYKISKLVNGRLVIDPDLVREAGRETAKLITERDGALFDLSLGSDIITSPILRTDKFNGLIASAVRLKEQVPDVFDNDATLIDNLFSLMVRKELPLDTQKLIDILDEFDVSIEDYTLMLVSGGSDAGTILGKISQLRNKTGAMRQFDRDKLRMERIGPFRRGLMRTENIRRGGLVSQFATMSRNLFTAGVRVPLEAFGNVVDNAMFAAQGLGRFEAMKDAPRIQGKAGSVDNQKIYGTDNLDEYSEPNATKRFSDQMFSGENWADAFRSAQLMFSRSDLAKEYTDLILSQPQLSKQSSRLFDNLNEIQAIMGKGKGGIVDNVMSELEGVVEMLNVPNRWQEHLTRRAIFFSELERLAKREYGIELQKALDDGQLHGLLNDSSNTMPRPKNAKSFIHLIDEAANKALDLTYASAPEVPMFAAMARGITEYGGTMIIPFPRFLFKSMELMGQYGAGASIPLLRKMISVATKGKTQGHPLTAKDRQRISRNLQGIALFGAAYMYRNMEGAPEDWEEVSVGDKAQFSTVALYPIAPAMYMAEQVTRIREGGLDYALERFDWREFVETFTGSNFRAGVGDSIFEELAQVASSVDLTKGEAAGRGLGRIVGNYLGTWPVALAQVIDFQRITGKRGTEFKETADDPTFSFWKSLNNNMLQPFKRYMSPEEESKLPKKEYVNYPEGRDRLSPYLKPFGFTLTNRPPPANEYLLSLGVDWKVAGSRSKVPSIKNYEIKMINSVLESISLNAQQLEITFREDYASGGEGSLIQEEFTEKEYVFLKLRPIVLKQVRSYKALISEGAASEGSEYSRAMMAYRSLSPEFRRAATPMFIEEEGYVPDPTSATDLILLTKYGEIFEDGYTE